MAMKGIDLGTTNSAVAVLDGTTPKVYDNNEGQKYTPSAVYVDDRKQLFTGRLAKQRVENDPDNAVAEFKLQMGKKDHRYTFARSGRVMSPEELSAEVLKSLRADVERAGDEMTGAVIGVPADFELPSCQATERAGRLVGLEPVFLVQEPVAAALAYGFQCESDRVHWLVYDLGGGTFDAAIVRVRDGEITVVNHGGDNTMGGKLIDWAIVDQILAPALLAEYRQSLSDFQRDNPKWRRAFAQLKNHAEEAKIRLSRSEVAPILIDPLCQDDRGDWVRFEYELKRSEIEPLIAPVVASSLQICARVLQEKQLAAGDIEKVILVGGPTLTPLLREMLGERLGIPLEYRVDPLTVVAQGAAIFAATQREEPRRRPETAGAYTVDLQYEPVGSDPDPEVAGRVHPPWGGEAAGLTLEFAAESGAWRSGQIPLGGDGTFVATLRAERGRANTYRLELRDAAGRLLAITPDRLSYTIGITPGEQMLIHSLGVGLAGNEMEVFIAKGSPLPARGRRTLRSIAHVQRGEAGTLLRIPLLEGENRRADRNRLVGALVVNGQDVRRDVPIGSEIEVAIEIDRSRLVQAGAYIPILDQEFQAEVNLERPAHTPRDLARALEREKTRLDKAAEDAQKAGDSQARAAVDTARAQVPTVEEALRSAAADQDAADRCHALLLALRCAVDAVEEGLDLPLAVAEVEEHLANARGVVAEHGDESHRRRLKEVEATVQAAVAGGDREVLRRAGEQARQLFVDVLTRQPEFWVAYLAHLSERRDQMTDRALANQLFTQARRSVSENDLDGLRSAVRQLAGLLPDGPGDAGGVLEEFISHVTRGF